MAWRHPGDKPLSEPMVVSLPTHICVARPQWVNIPYLNCKREIWGVFCDFKIWSCSSAFARPIHHDIKSWKIRLHYWPFVQGTHWWFPTGRLSQQRPLTWSLMFSLRLAYTTVEQTVELPVICDPMMLMWPHCNVKVIMNHGHKDMVIQGEYRAWTSSVNMCLKSWHQQKVGSKSN